MPSSDSRSAVGPQRGPTTAHPVLRVERLRVRYDKLTAVRDVDLDLTAGSITVLLGLNGAGKSSIMNAVAGVVPADAGAIRLSGRDVSRLPAHRRARAGLAYLPEGRGVFPSLTVQQNLLLGSPRRADDAHATDTAYDLFPVLGERRRQAAGLLSGGEQQMLSLARCLAGRPTLLLLDEPSLGLAPRIVAELFATLDRLRGDGLTILMVEQFAHAALAVADTAGVLVRGELTRFGPAAGLRGLSPEELGDLFFSDADQPSAAPVPEERAS